MKTKLIAATAVMSVLLSGCVTANEQTTEKAEKYTIKNTTSRIYRCPAPGAEIVALSKDMKFDIFVFDKDGFYKDRLSNDTVTFIGDTKINIDSTHITLRDCELKNVPGYIYK